MIIIQNFRRDIPLKGKYTVLGEFAELVVVYDKLLVITGLYSHTHAHTCIATQVYDLKSGYVGGPGLLKSRV
jgi:hypothetical protein